MTQGILKFLIDKSDPWNQKFQTVFLIMKQLFSSGKSTSNVISLCKSAQHLLSSERSQVGSGGGVLWLHQRMKEH